MATPRTSDMDIVEFINNNPIKNISNSDFLINKIKEQFTDDEQKLFVTSFYTYLDCDEDNDYVVDLDKVWKWIGFANKGKAKELLLKHFIKDNDYKIALLQPQKRKNEGETIFPRTGKNKINEDYK